MIKTKVFILACFTSLSHFSYGQIDVPQDPNFAVGQRPLREANVKYSKRIHRVIDTRMKQNKVLDWPRSPLNRMMYQAATSGLGEWGTIPAYATDSLIRPMTKAEIIARGSDSLTFQIPDWQNPGQLKDTTVFNPLVVEDIVKFRVMEDWIFDFQYGDLRPKIIAICPLFEWISQSGIPLGDQPLFWMKMDDLRPILAKYKVFNPKNSAGSLTFTQWFEMRHFDSHIVKESNVYDLDVKYIEEYRDDGIAALLKSDAIKNDLFIMEHDLWEY